MDTPTLHDSEQVGLMNMNVSRNGDLIFLKKVMPTDIGFPQRHENTSPNSTKPLETFTGVTVAGKNLAPNRETFTSNVFLLQNTMQNLSTNAPRGLDTNYTKTNVLFMYN